MLSKNIKSRVRDQMNIITNI